jgi:hypothetical protein
MVKRNIAIISILLLISACSYKKKIDATNISLSPFFSSGMILQSHPQTTIWGKAAPNTTLAVKLAEYIKLTTADDAGNWSTTFPKIILEKPFTIRVEGADTSITINNIQAGKYIVIAGDANLLQHQLLGDKSCNIKEIKSNMRFRVFRPELSYSEEPQPDFTSGRWYPPEEAGKALKTCKAIQAVRQLLEQSDVPIGIIDLTWPGSSGTNWLPKFSGLGKNRELQSTGQLYNAKELDSLAMVMVAMSDSCREGVEQGALRTWFNDETWKTTQLPFVASKATGFPKERITYLRKRFNVPARFADKGIVINMGVFLGKGEFFVNQNQVSPYFLDDGTVHLDVPDSLIKVWTNILTIRLFSTDEYTGFYGNDFTCTNADSSFQTNIRENWKYKSDYEANFPVVELPVETPSICFQAALVPLKNIAPDAFIFYFSNFQYGKSEIHPGKDCEISAYYPDAMQKILAIPEFTISDTMVYRLDLEYLADLYNTYRDSCAWQIKTVEK